MILVKTMRHARHGRRGGHLYKGGAKYREKKSFEKKYGKKKGDYVYGATVGKVKREQMAKKKRRGF